MSRSTWSSSTDSDTAQRLVANAARLLVEADKNHVWLRHRHGGWWEEHSQVWVVPLPHRAKQVKQLLVDLQRTKLKYREGRLPLREIPPASSEREAHVPPIGPGMPVPEVEAVGCLGYSRMRRMVDVCDATVRGVRDRALVLCCWELMASPAQMQAIDVSDLRATPSGLEVQVKGQPAVMAYRSDPVYCPVRALGAYMELREQAQLLSGPVWLRTRSLKNRGWALTSTPLTVHGIAERLNTVAAASGLRVTGTAKGLRQGAIATAAAAGASRVWLAAQSRQELHSPTLERLMLVGLECAPDRPVDLWEERPLDRRAKKETPSSTLPS